MNKYLEKLNKSIQSFDGTVLEQYASEYDVPIIEYESLMVLKLLIRTNKVKRILEIGTAIGYSSLHMASINEDIQIDTIERNEEMYNLAINNIKEANMEKQINVHFADALKIDLSELKEQYDMIFIDAAKAQSGKFFNRFSPLLNKDGIIVTDNILFHGCVESQEGLTKNVLNMVKKIDAYNHHLATLNDYDTIYISTGDGLAVTTRKK